MNYLSWTFQFVCCSLISVLNAWYSSSLAFYSKVKCYFDHLVCISFTCSINHTTNCYSPLVYLQRAHARTHADYQKLMIVGECITALLFPFVWPHVYAPILPVALHHFLDAPVPFVMGLHADSESYLKIGNEATLCCVDIDKKTIQLPEELPLFPHRSDFIAEISAILDKFNVNYRDKSVRDAIQSMSSQMTTNNSSIASTIFSSRVMTIWALLFYFTEWNFWFCSFEKIPFFCYSTLNVTYIYHFSYEFFQKKKLFRFHFICILDFVFHSKNVSIYFNLVRRVFIRFHFSVTNLWFTFFFVYIAAFGWCDDIQLYIAIGNACETKVIVAWHIRLGSSIVTKCAGWTNATTVGARTKSNYSKATAEQCRVATTNRWYYATQWRWYRWHWL